MDGVVQSGPEAFVLSFVPLFIVIDAFGNLPFVLALSEDMSRSERRKMIHLAVLVAAIVSLAFLLFGQFILDVLNIPVGAFAIAGGLLLLALSINYVLTGRITEVAKEEMVAVVPIGTPLLAGPAAITTLLLLVSQFPTYIVLLALLLNLFIAWTVFLLGNQIVRFAGRGGLRAISRVFSLLLAAIAVSMILRGLELLGLLEITS